MVAVAILLVRSHFDHIAFREFLNEQLDIFELTLTSP